MSRVFYTDFGILEYKRKNGKIGRVNKVNSKIVMLVLSDAANDEGKNSWQAVETIAGKSSLDWRTVTRTLIALRQNEYIWVDGKSEYDTNNYSINLEKIVEIPKVKRYPSTKKRYRKGDRGVTVTKLVCHGDRESIIYPSINNIPAIAGEKLCECEGEQMCEKCEQVKREIETGKEHGFELGVSMKKKHLKELQKIHEFEGNTDVLPKQSVEQKVLQMMSGHDEYAEKASGYPETVQKSVKLFAETFKISPSAIPKKSKGKGGMFATWVKGIQDLQSIAGNERRFKLVLDKVYEVWNNRATEFKTHVDMPQKIRGSFVTMESELTQLEEKQKQEVAERVIETTAKKEVYITDDETLRNEGVADLKKLLRSYKNG
jgi:hypothetical protein